MLRLENISKSYTQKQKVLKNINLCLPQNASLALVGESGSGKSTLARLILGLEKADSGNISIEGKKLKEWKKKNKGGMSVVFQDYTSSINPRFLIKDILQEALWQEKKRLNETELKELLSQVELSAKVLKSYPHELSGGQLQRICIARSLVLKPRLLILDEALSSLDVSTQAQVVALLKRLQEEYKMSYLFISHDLESASAVCDEIAVLYEGQIVEKFSTCKLKDTKHFYTKKLLDSIILIRK
jgi:nickel transport system ATP-binding protein